MDPNNFLESIPCPLCGNEKLDNISRQGQFGLPCYVSICPLDGFVFLSPRWTKKKYMHFYKEEYDSFYRPKECLSGIYTPEYKNIKIICHRLENLNLMDGRNSVLDVGAGMGWYLQWIKLNYNFFNEFSAIEASDNCIIHLQEVLEINLVSDDIDSDWQSTGFDLVIMRHVLEHTMNPVEALKRVAANLSEGGIIYMAVPDMMKPKGSLHDWFRSVHTFYFSSESLVSIASLANLELITMHQEDSEIWAIFKKASVENGNVIINVYEKQISIINAYKRWSFIRDARNKCIQVFLFLIPRKLKSWLKNKIFG
jgi:2-polyprenyl-3-methyl-5-hydroxy-6-metoxy-1,4-benzoquinol methylase